MTSFVAKKLDIFPLDNPYQDSVSPPATSNYVDAENSEKNVIADCANDVKEMDREISLTQSDQPQVGLLVHKLPRSNIYGDDHRRQTVSSDTQKLYCEDDDGFSLFQSVSRGKRMVEDFSMLADAAPLQTKSFAVKDAAIGMGSDNERAYQTMMDRETGEQNSGDHGEIGVLQQKFLAALRGKFRRTEFDAYLSDLAIARVSSELVTFETNSPERCDVIGRHYLTSMKKVWIDCIAPVEQVSIKLSAQVSRSLRDHAQRVQETAAPPNLDRTLMPMAKPATTSTSGQPFFKDISGQFSGATSAASTGANLLPKGRGQKPVLTLEDLISPVDERNSFDNFVVDASNQVAHAAARTAVSGEGAAEIIYLYGKSGVGKTHLLHAITLEAQRLGSHFKTAFLTYNNIESGCVNAILSNNTNALLREFLGCRVVLFDDIHFLTGKEKTQEQLLTIIDACRASGIFVVVAGDCSAVKLAEKGINQRLADRLGSGLSVAVMSGGPHLRFDALKKRVAARTDLKCKFTDEALDFIVRNFTFSMRETCGALTQLMMLYGSKEIVVDLPLARNALRSRLQDGKPSRTLDDLVDVTAEVFDVSVDDMKGKARPQCLARARHAFAYCARDILKESLPRISATLNRDHTTALSSLKRAAALLERDKVFCKQVNLIREKMEP